MQIVEAETDHNFAVNVAYLASFAHDLPRKTELQAPDILMFLVSCTLYFYFMHAVQFYCIVHHRNTSN